MITSQLLYSTLGNGRLCIPVYSVFPKFIFRKAEHMDVDGVQRCKPVEEAHCAVVKLVSSRVVQRARRRSRNRVG